MYRGEMTQRTRAARPNRSRCNLPTDFVRFLLVVLVVAVSLFVSVLDVSKTTKTSIILFVDAHISKPPQTPQTAQSVTTKPSIKSSSSSSKCNKKNKEKKCKPPKNLVDSSAQTSNGHDNDDHSTTISKAKDHPKARNKNKKNATYRNDSQLQQSQQRRTVGAFSTKTTITTTTTGTKSVHHRRSDRTRRLLSEWKDLIASGHAYHWGKRKRLLLNKDKKKRRNTKAKNTRDSENVGESTADDDEENGESDAAAMGGTYFVIGPLMEKNLNIWHFSLCGPASSVFEGGLYHGRLVLPNDYPLKPPISIEVWTPSGRFQTRKSICLSASQYHPEEWNPSQWTIRTLIEGLRLHFVTSANEIAGRNDSYEQRYQYAQQSRYWKCALRPINNDEGNDAAMMAPIVIDHEQMIKDGIFDGYLSLDGNREEVKATVEQERKSNKMPKSGNDVDTTTKHATTNQKKAKKKHTTKEEEGTSISRDAQNTISAEKDVTVHVETVPTKTVAAPTLTDASDEGNQNAKEVSSDSCAVVAPSKKKRKELTLIPSSSTSTKQKGTNARRRAKQNTNHKPVAFVTAKSRRHENDHHGVGVPVAEHASRQEQELQQLHRRKMLVRTRLIKISIYIFLLMFFWLNQF